MSGKYDVVIYLLYDATAVGFQFRFVNECMFVFVVQVQTTSRTGKSACFVVCVSVCVLFVCFVRV